MSVKIIWRCDQEEYHCTDDVTLFVNSWDEVLQEVKKIEAHCTVLSIERIMD